MTTISKVRDVQFWLHVGITWENLGGEKCEHEVGCGTQEGGLAEAGGSGVQVVFQDRLGYIRSCLKRKKREITEFHSKKLVLNCFNVRHE